ncbi:hypothetical protein CPB84DRAFT_1827120 [Gymnopilus junonius]|uniref:Uncharacterized protein n=1 Tax=Gymnopilus junonius TaxID=109634 RepID=A0A9P5NGC4_GYMJU|nr:hypothetical protein CPB84DRAFT_1827120 [Gymnopilus junonius]
MVRRLSLAWSYGYWHNASCAANFWLATLTQLYGFHYYIGCVFPGFMLPHFNAKMQMQEVNLVDIRGQKTVAGFSRASLNP